MNRCPGTTCSSRPPRRSTSRGTGATSMPSCALSTRAGGCTPSGSPTRSACTAARSRGSACWRSPRWAPGGPAGDTGMNPLGGWRQQAIDFMTSHTATTQANVRNEIDRYIAWPGQALAYVTGKREIVRLRARAQQALGPRFDLRQFHHAVLRNGAVPLTLLDDEIGRWTAAKTQDAREA